MRSSNIPAHDHGETRLYALAWDGNISIDSSWLTDQHTIIPIESLTDTPPQHRELLQRPACMCRGRIGGDQIEMRWRGVVNGPVVRSAIEPEYRYPGALLTRIGDAWFVQERIAMLRAVVPADLLRSVLVPDHTGKKHAALAGFRGQQRLWITFSSGVKSTVDDTAVPAWTGRIA